MSSFLIHTIDWKDWNNLILFLKVLNTTIRQSSNITSYVVKLNWNLFSPINKCFQFTSVILNNFLRTPISLQGIPSTSNFRNTNNTVICILMGRWSTSNILNNWVNLSPRTLVIILIPLEIKHFLHLTLNYRRSLMVISYIHA